MSTSLRNESTTAACLTPPAAGGIAVIQVVGRDAPAIVHPLLRAQRPIDVTRLDPGELRFCRIVEEDEVLDDAVIAARRLPGGEFVVDINLHGGPRIVQRVLLALQAAGAVVVEAGGQAATGWPVESLLEHEALEMLPQARTRAVAAWLMRAPAALTAAAREIERLIAGGEQEAARAALAGLLRRSVEARHLIRGLRVVLIGRPNSGKSTLANALAGAEHSIVSEVPGTTRDWVGLPAAIDGMPVTLVDTAGVRDTNDPLERESIRRAHGQTMRADVVIHVVDGSTPPEEPEAHRPAAIPDPDRDDPHPEAGEGFFFPRGRPGAAGAGPENGPHPHPGPCHLLVWNKSDLPVHPARGGREGAGDEPAGPAALAVSGLTGAGLADLRRRILEAVGMVGWTERPARLYTLRQLEICRDALATLSGRRDSDPSAALRGLTAQMSHFFPLDHSGMI